MPNTDIETCRRCGKTGYKIDEFLENPNNLYGGTTCNGKTIRDIYHKMPEDWRLVNTIWYMDEFRVPLKGDWYLQPHSHLAAMCYGTGRMRPRIILKVAPYRAPTPTPPPAPSGKNQPEQVRRFTRQDLETMEAEYRVLGRAALMDYLEGHIEETLYAIRSQVRRDEGECGPGPKTP